MKKQYFFVMLLLISCVCSAQNLVPNGNFESFSTCPVTFGELFRAAPWTNPTSSSPDYFNQCASSTGVPANGYGYQAASSGVGYAGIMVGRTDYNYESFREYIQVQLTSTLVAGTCYNFQMRLSLADQCKYTSDVIGVHFRSTQLTYSTYNTLWFINPQISMNIGFVVDSANWTTVTGTFTANGGEKYIVIGNFKDSSQTGMQLVNAGGLRNWSYFYIDDVCLTACSNSCTTGIDEQYSNDNIKINRNPFGGTLAFTSSSNELMEVVLMDMSMRKVLSSTFRNSVSFNTEGLPRGIYFYEVRSAEGVIQNGKVVKE